MLQKINVPFLISMLFFIATGSNSVGYAQISEGGIPVSFHYTYNTLKSNEIPVRIPVLFSVEDLKAVDAWRVRQGAPLRISKLIDTDIDLTKEAKRITLPGGEMVWRLHIEAEGAIALMLYYDAFFIPEGAKLYIYNADHSQVIGAFTHRTNPKTTQYATEFIAGDELVLEYEPGNSIEQPQIRISQVGYGYNHLSVTTKADSGSCMVNINCEEGDAWQKEKRGVCRIIEKIGKDGFLCSGSLVNNTKEDLKPYILSAFHCTKNEKGDLATPDDFNNWIFYFHYEYVNCNGDIENLYKTIVGATKKAFTDINKASDGLLLLLNQQIPESYNVYYNGWDREEIAPQSGVGIHHPGGDYKKISTFNSPAIHATWYGDDDTEGDKKAHWNVVFNQTVNGHGVTEGGSSGSPLFNENGLIVGTLSGGISKCGSKEDQEGFNLYGKMSHHWNKYMDSDSTHMDTFLDPMHTNNLRLEGRYADGRKPAPSDLKAVYKQKKVNISWKAPASANGLDKYFVYLNNTLLSETTSTSYVYETEDFGEKLFRVSVHYKDGKESAVVNKRITIPEFKAPLNATFHTSGNNVVLNWKQPEYLQTVFWGKENIELALWSFGTEPLYVGQLWEPADLAPIHESQLKEVHFYPIKGASYSIFISQGKRTYTQKVENPEYNNVFAVKLDTSFTIDASQNLVVSIYVHDIEKDLYPFVTDQGPAVMQKGNIVSEDGKKWDYFYAPDQDFDCNFFIQAKISSEKGLLPLSKASGIITAFPEITAYYIYRNGHKIGETNGNTMEYTDKNAASANYTYEISSVYADEESKKTSVTKAAPVHNETIMVVEPDIFPTHFDTHVRLIGNETVNRLEIISVSGQTVLRQEHPAPVIDTEILPSGMYLFRIYMNDGQTKTIKGIK